MNKTPVIQCKNCGNEFQGNYCNICGQKVITSRFTLKIFLKDILRVFNLERGLFFTIQQLLKNPGKVLKEYLNGRTKDYYNPLKFLILVAGLSALIVLVTKAYDNSVQLSSEFTSKLVENPDAHNPYQDKVQDFMRNYLNIVTLVMMPFFAIGFRILFSRTKLYYSEHLIINFYAFGVGTLLSLVITLLLLFIPGTTAIDMILGWSVLITIYAYFYHKLTEKNIIVTFFLSLLSIIIGFVLLMILAMFIVFAIVFIMKKFNLNLF